MQALWQLRKAFVKEIVAELENPPPTTTVSSTVRKLERDGFVGHDAFGKTHRYYPVVSKENYRTALFRHFMKSYFSGSPEQLLIHFVEEEAVSYGELEDLLNKMKRRRERDE
jgi:BlaI family transcriptional regulator, penicillinase repressor